MRFFSLTFAIIVTSGLFGEVDLVYADPCGMVPPITTSGGPANLVRTGEQQTYVFHRNGLETFVIRPGFTGKVEEFGMLIPFPEPPAIRKVPDAIFHHIAAAIDPPEVVVDLRPVRKLKKMSETLKRDSKRVEYDSLLGINEVAVLREEAVGMYEVAVLSAGSPAALKRWMTEHSYRYPKGMDDVCAEYIESNWCFVAIKTKVSAKKTVAAKPGQRKVAPSLPSGGFEGSVQAMGFRFPSEKLVVPMRLSAFNDGELRNIVYVLTDKPTKVNRIPEEYVVRQLAGKKLLANVTNPLPLRILGGTAKDIPKYRLERLSSQRDPHQHNGAAKELFASDLLAADTERLSLPHEQREKELLRIGERLMLRGADIDRVNEAALATERSSTVEKSLSEVTNMTLSVIDGDFPREVVGDDNLTFATYSMPASRNHPALYDAMQQGPATSKAGIRHVGALNDFRFSNPIVHENRTQQKPSRKIGWSQAIFLTLLAGCFVGMVCCRRKLFGAVSSTFLTCFLTTIIVLAMSKVASADPCGMVPPIYTGETPPLARVGEQQTYVFYKDGIETIVIRPGFQGSIDNFGMLIPFPTPPALRKVPDNVFSHLAAAIDPPEVVVDLLPQPQAAQQGGNSDFSGLQFSFRRSEVRVLRREAVGMYEVAVLEAGSSAALKRWMTENGFVFPVGMDEVCDEYISDRWCFVAVKTKVGSKENADPHSGQREADTKLKPGSSFTGHVQGMGFRFRTSELVVPMRLSAFNDGDLRNVVYLLADSPKRIRSIPEEYVVRQVAGKTLYANLTEPLPLRIIGGTFSDIPRYLLKNLSTERNPAGKNGIAKDLFASDLAAVSSKTLSLQHEENEKELLRISERLQLRGQQIDNLHDVAIASQREKANAKYFETLKGMTLTVIDGDFPRSVLASQNLKFAKFEMPSSRNSAEYYDANSKKPARRKAGIRHSGALPTSKPNTGIANTIQPQSNESYRLVWIIGGCLIAALVGFAIGAPKRNGG